MDIIDNIFLGSKPKLYWQNDAALQNGNSDGLLNYTPFLEINFGAGLPFYNIINDHLLSFSLDNNIGTLIFYDSTNFIFERLLKYAFAKNKGKGLLMRWGWTNGAEKITQPEDKWTTLIVTKIASTPDTNGTRWTLVLSNFLSYAQDLIKISRSITISNLANLDDLEREVNIIVAGSPKIVFTKGLALKDAPNWAQAGVYTTTGDVSLGEFIRDVVQKRWVSESTGKPPEISISNAVFEGQSAEPQINVLLYDIKDLLDSRSAKNSSVSATDLDNFSNCDFVLRYPTNENGILGLSFGQDLSWSDLALARNLYVDNSGNVIVTTSESEIPANAIVQTRNRIGENAVTATAGADIGRSQEIGDNEATPEGIARVMEKVRYQSMRIVLTLRGEPELFDCALLKGHRIGLIINIAPFVDSNLLSYGDDDASFGRAFPMFSGPNKETFNILKEVFQHNDENFYSQFTGIWLVQNLRQNISAGSYVTELDLVKSGYEG